MDFTEFIDWLKEAEQQIGQAEKNVGQELPTLKKQSTDHVQFIDDINDQKGDLKFLNKAGQTFLDFSKVGEADRILGKCLLFLVENLRIEEL